MHVHVYFLVIALVTFELIATFVAFFYIYAQ